MKIPSHDWEASEHEAFVPAEGLQQTQRDHEGACLKSGGDAQRVTAPSSRSIGAIFCTRQPISPNLPPFAFGDARRAQAAAVTQGEHTRCDALVPSGSPLQTPAFASCLWRLRAGGAGGHSSAARSAPYRSGETTARSERHAAPPRVSVSAKPGCAAAPDETRHPARSPHAPRSPAPPAGSDWAVLAAWKGGNRNTAGSAGPAALWEAEPCKYTNPNMGGSRVGLRFRLHSRCETESRQRLWLKKNTRYSQTFPAAGSLGAGGDRAPLLAGAQAVPPPCWGQALRPPGCHHPLRSAGAEPAAPKVPLAFPLRAPAAPGQPLPVTAAASRRTGRAAPVPWPRRSRGSRPRRFAPGTLVCWHRKEQLGQTGKSGVAGKPGSAGAQREWSW